MEMTVEIRGYLVGGIWWPSGAECYKPLAYDVLAEQARTVGGKMTLREHVLRATNDGDFQSAELADAELIVTTYKARGASTIKRTRAWPLERFPSVADCIKADWSGPCGECD